ncbi:MAG: PQQ-like beta-propeller repeat protein [Archangiaceae bacterium]|nr:PQQ-like beta-propeller repeat protein [Archangiaceae bacterium]
MIRFRLGQSWKHEGAEGEPSDAISLELDGVDLLAGAKDEPLTRAVPAVVDALCALGLGGERVAQVSLTEAELELCLMRRESSHDVELSVVSLGRAAKLLRGPLTLDLLELAQAAARCGEALLRDVRERSPELARTSRLQQLQTQARKLSTLEHPKPLPLVDPGAWSHLEQARPGALGFRLEDSSARLLSWSRRSAAPLPPLLVTGELSAEDGRVEKGLPVLMVLEASRKASTLGENEQVALGPSLASSPAEVFSLGLKLCVALATRNPALALNPYLEALSERCREGLAALRQPTPPELPLKRGAKKARAVGKRLTGPGALRRLRFAVRWEKETPGLEGEGELRLAAKGPMVVTAHAAMAFHTDGRVLYRRVEAGGLNVSDDGRALVTNKGRLLFFAGASKEATWLRDYDGPPLHGPIYRKGSGLLISLANRGVACFSEATGAEQWRVDPARAQAGHVGVHGERVLLATDTGSLLGLDLSSGVTRFRIRASLPFTAAPVAGGRRLVALLSRGERTALIAADLASGTLQWSKELTLERPAAPALYRNRVLLAGRRGGKTWLSAFSRTGEQQWERALPLEGSQLFVLALTHGALVQDSRGAAAVVSSDGQIDWVLGTAGADLPHRVGPACARGVVVLAGETVRAVDPRSGRLLAEVKVGPALTALAADRQLNLYLLMENGLLRALKLAAQLSVV